jgi:hypothetical protein
LEFIMAEYYLKIGMRVVLMSDDDSPIFIIHDRVDDIVWLIDEYGAEVGVCHCALLEQE